MTYANGESTTRKTHRNSFYCYVNIRWKNDNTISKYYGQEREEDRKKKEIERETRMRKIEKAREKNV